MDEKTTLDAASIVDRMEQLAALTLSSDPSWPIGLLFQDAAHHLRRLLDENERLRLAVVTAAPPLEAMVAGGPDVLHSADVRAAIHEGLASVRKALVDE